MKSEKTTSANSSDIVNGLKALAHPTRFEIIRQLAMRERCCAGDFCECLPLAQSTISQHLEMLREAGLVDRSPAGTKSIFNINKAALEELRDAIDDIAKILPCPCDGAAKKDLKN